MSLCMSYLIVFLKIAFSVQELPSGFWVKNSQKENYSTLVVGGQRLNLQQFPIIDDQQQVLNDTVSINETGKRHLNIGTIKSIFKKFILKHFFYRCRYCTSRANRGATYC